MPLSGNMRLNTPATLSQKLLIVDSWYFLIQLTAPCAFHAVLVSVCSRIITSYHCEFFPKTFLIAKAAWCFFPYTWRSNASRPSVDKDHAFLHTIHLNLLPTPLITPKKSLHKSSSNQLFWKCLTFLSFSEVIYTCLK